MGIVTLQELREHIGLTEDAPEEDSLVLQHKGDAAQNHIERMLGFRIEERFGGEDQEQIPDSLKEAVMQLAAWWFDNRETVGDVSKSLPFGVTEIVNEYREWAF